MNRRKQKRNGAVAALIVLLLIPMLALVALAVDYGYLLVVRTDLQRAVDNAALAAVRDLIPAADGTQDLDAVRASVRRYARLNFGDDSFVVLDEDIEIGRYDPETIYSGVTLLNTGIKDTVRVTLRYDNRANSPVSLFFARVIGIKESSVAASATAILQKGHYMTPGTGVLPFAMPLDHWDSQSPGDVWSIYGDGKMKDIDGDPIPGNWGTLDIGDTGNSTSDLSDQIKDGLTQKDLNALHSDGTISDPNHIDGSQELLLNADTGLSGGLKHAMNDVEGITKIVPIYDTASGNGNNAYFEIVGWGVVQVVDSKFAGSNNTYVQVQKAYTYDSHLEPHPDLSNTSDVIEGAFTSPALVQ